jgi:hypothetical protein
MTKSLGSALVLSLGLAAAATAADYRSEKSFDLASGGSFALRSEGGSIEVHGVEGNRATVVITSDRDDFEQIFNVRYDAEPSHLGVVIERRSHGLFQWFGGFHGRIHVDVTVPRKVSSDVHSSGGGVEISALDGNVKADSSGGGVHISDIAGDLDLSSSGGSVKVEHVRGAVKADSSGGGVHLADVAGTVHLESSGGSVTAERIGGDIEASSSGGGVRIEDAGGAVVADSSGGPVHVTFAAGNAKGGSLDSSGGGVVAKVDPSVGLEIDASSSGGSVDSDLPVTIRGKVSRASLHGKLNGGGATLKLRSSGGGISLEGR